YSPPSDNLPETGGEILPVAQNQAPVQSTTPELQGASSELPTNSPAPPVPSAVTPGNLAVANPAPAPPASVSPSTQTLATPAAADDADLIEKEWVQRAKALVAATKDNPHQQNKEMNKFKADYIKKRYNKEIKVSEG